MDEKQKFCCKGCGKVFGKEADGYSIASELYFLLETTVYCRTCNTITTWTFKDNLAKMQLENILKHPLNT